jgi:hypothetical protein
MARRWREEEEEGAEVAVEEARRRRRRRKRGFGLLVTTDSERSGLTRKGLEGLRWRPTARDRPTRMIAVALGGSGDGSGSLCRMGCRPFVGPDGPSWVRMAACHSA